MLIRPSAARALLLAVLALPLVAAPAAGPAHAATPTPVRVLVPDPDNLQYLAFWVALGAGHFKQEGLTVRVVPAGAPGAASQEFMSGAAEIAILPPPQYGQLVSQGQPVLAFANLLQHEPANVVVQREIAAARGLTPALALHERVRRLQGLRIGVASGPASRLRLLLAAAGLEPDRDAQLVLVPGEEQVTAFAERRVDALFAHTPYLEEVLRHHGASLAANLSSGEFPALAGMQLHVLATRRDFAATHGQVLTSLARGIQRAQRLLHTDKTASSRALREARMVGLDLALVDTTIALYAPAVPRSPAVSPEAAQRAVQAWGGGAAGFGAAAVDVAGPAAGGGGGGGGGGAGGGASPASAPAANRPAASLPPAAFADHVAIAFAEEAARPQHVGPLERLAAAVGATAPAAILLVGALILCGLLYGYRRGLAEAS